MGVDAGGGPVIDPTENVIALTEAANKRQDDLRQLNNQRIDATIQVLAEKMAGLDKSLTEKVEGLEKRLILRAEHSQDVRKLETERVNAIRQVDVLAQNTAAERALVAIQTLAQQTTAERETLRNLVTTSAATLATQNAQDLARINEAISALQKSSYEGAGKQAVADPMMAEMVTELKALRLSVVGQQSQTTGQGQGQKNIVTYISVGISILLGLLLLADRFGK